MFKAIKAVELRDNFKQICEGVTAGDTVIITRPKGQNVVLVSEKVFNAMLSAARQERRNG